MGQRGGQASAPWLGQVCRVLLYGKAGLSASGVAGDSRAAQQASQGGQGGRAGVQPPDMHGVFGVYTAGLWGVQI